MFDHFGKIPSISYPGVAQLVGRLVWDQDAASSSLATRTKTASFQLKGFSLFIAVHILTYHSDPKSDLQYEISHSVNSSLYSDLHTECSIVKSNLPQRSNVVYPSDG